MVERHNMSHVKSCETAKAAWDALKKAFDEKGHWRYVSLVRTFNDLKLEKFESMEKYISEALRLSDCLKTLKEPISDTRLAAMILAGLPSDYDNLAMALTSGETLDLEGIKSALIDEGFRRKLNGTGGKSSSYYTKKFRNSHQNAAPKSKTKGDRSNWCCWNCSEKGHGRDECPKSTIQGQSKSPRGSPGAEGGGGTHQRQQRSLFCALSASKVNNSFVLDSGCTGHMCFDSKLMSNYKSCSSDLNVVIGNDDQLAVKGKGDINVTVSQSIGKISDVMHVPDVKVNLLSISQIADKDAVVVFSKDGCKIFDVNSMKISGEILATGTRENGLYF